MTRQAWDRTACPPRSRILVIIQWDWIITNTIIMCKKNSNNLELLNAHFQTLLNILTFIKCCETLE